MTVAVVQPGQQGAPVNPLAAIGGQIGSFLWGSNGQMLTPAQIASQRSVAQAMMAQAPAPRTLGEGLSAIGKALIAKSLMDQANTSQTEGLQSANDAMAAATAPGADGSTLIPAIENQYLTPGQQSVAQAMLTQRMMLTNPDEIAQRNYMAAETAKDQAQANEMTTGGPNMGTPVLGNDGNYYAAPTYGTGMRQLATPGAPSPTPAPTSALPPQTAISTPLPMASASSQPSPASASIMDMGGGTTLPAVAAAPAPAPAAGGTAAASGGPFLNTAQQKEADAQATAAGTALGTAPADVNTALSGSRGANQMYAAGINNVNAALNALASDKLGTIDTSTGLASLSKAIPGTPAYNLSKALASLQGLSALATMSDARSGDGGSSPVQVRNQREFEAVASAAGNLDQGQSTAQLANSLKSLKAQMLAGMHNRAQDIADLRALGKLPGGMPASSQADPYAGPGAYGLINAAPDNHPVVTTPQEAAAFPVGTVVIAPDAQGNPVSRLVTAQFKAAYGATQ